MKEGENIVAIKIIQKGHKRQTARVTCPHCYSVLEYTEADVKTSIQYNSEDTWIACPVCGTAIDVDLARAFPWVGPEPEIYDDEADDIRRQRAKDVGNGWIYD